MVVRPEYIPPFAPLVAEAMTGAGKRSVRIVNDHGPMSSGRVPALPDSPS